MTKYMQLSIVTGGNRGIGLALTALLRERGHHVLATCRKKSDALAKLDVEVLEDVDVSDAAGIDKLRQVIGTRHVDLLINNAGIFLSDQLPQLNVDNVRRQFEVNALAPLRVTLALRETLSRGSKVALITSRMGSVADNTSGGSYGYRMSKAALNIAGKSLANDLKGDGIAVAILHPGMVSTDMINNKGQIEPAEAAKGLLARIDALTLATSGTFWHQNGETLPW